MESGLLISNLKSTVDEKTIRSYFEKFGKITYLSLKPDKFSENCKVCYINYNSIESATRAVSETDKSVLFGDQLRVSYKKISPTFDRNSINGNFSIGRKQSYGRGRGLQMDNNRSVQVTSSPVVLRNIDIPINTKIEVNIVVLDNVNNILARPTSMIEDILNLNEILNAINENTHTLIDVKAPEINGFYMAMWQEDQNFYRAKLLEKLGDHSYKVCFVDEGTSGDIVHVLKEIPKEISEFPCQFLSCDMGCENSVEFIKFILSTSETSKVSIYVTNPELKDGRYRVNLFIDNNDVIDLYKRKHRIDLRKNKFPNESSLKKYKIDTEFKEYIPLSYPKQERDLFKIRFLNKAEISIQSEPLTSLPIQGDVVVYRKSLNSLHRCVIQSTNVLSNNKINYVVRLIDEDKTFEVDRESLFRINENSLQMEPHILTCVMNLDCKFLTPDCKGTKIRIVDCDTIKNIYVIEMVQEKPIVKIKPNKLQSSKHSRVFISHVESYEEFYVQMADEESILSLQQIQYEINNNYISEKFRKIHDISVNKLVIAPFQGINYRAVIKEINASKCLVRVCFIDYGNCDWVALTDISGLKINISSIPAMGFRCKLLINVKSINLSEVNDLLAEYSGEGDVEITLDIITESNSEGLLCSNLFAENMTSFVDILKFKKLISDSLPDVINFGIIEQLISKIQNLECRIKGLEKNIIGETK